MPTSCIDTLLSIGKGRGEHRRTGTRSWSALILASFMVPVLVQSCFEGPGNTPVADADTDMDADTDTDTDTTAIQGSGFEIRLVHPGGVVDVVSDDMGIILEKAFAEVELTVPGKKNNQVIRTSSTEPVSSRLIEDSDELGQAERLVLVSRDASSGLELTLRISTYDDKDFFTAELTTKSISENKVILARQVPLKVDSAVSGGLWIGSHPSKHRILEAGSFLVFDFFVDLLPGDVNRPIEADALESIHGCLHGDSVSNWNHAVKDTASGMAFVAGSLDFEHSSPMATLGFDPGLAETREARTNFTYWAVEYPYLPSGKPLEPGQAITAGPVFIVPLTPDVHNGLEEYGDALKAYNEIELWPERGPENRVPTGWNSWTGSGGSSGGYGTDIDEDLMLANLEAMATEFKDFGGEWFQIDDGYETYYGDWDFRADRFPHGQDWLAERIMEKGLIPGLWIAPFQVDERSDTYKAHVRDGWFPERIPLAGGDKPVLDLTRPDVLEWLENRFRRIRASGYRWIKTDFVYWALGAASFHDPSATREEAYRMGLKAIEQGLALGANDAGGSQGDTFWLAVSMIGPHMGYADSVRPNLDTMPAWDKSDVKQARKTAQGFKPTYRSIARRYYLHNRAYIFNHDMIFFRSSLDPDIPAITRNESRCLLTAVALSGSVAKLGEKLVEMEPEWINDYRKVIPVYGRSGRPLDLFEKEYPEVWHLHVVPGQGLNTNGAGPEYDVVAFFNWGENVDLTTNPYTAMPDQVDRKISVDLRELGLTERYVAREFWSGDFLDSIESRFGRTVEPHTVQVFALRKRLDRPMFVGDDRHVLQGSVEVLGSSWDPGTHRLSMTYDAAAGSAKARFTHKLYFFVPEGYKLDRAEVAPISKGSLQVSQSGGLLEVTFETDQRSDANVVLKF